MLSQGDIPYHLNDALVRKSQAELEVFTNWLATNNVQGYIGEIGWPANNDVERWNNVARHYFDTLAALDIIAAVWQSGAHMGGDILGQYFGTGEITSNAANTRPLELAARYKAVNVTGSANARNVVGSNGGLFSNFNPGVLGVDYFYPTLTSLQFLATKGVTHIRLPVMWERIQPTLKAPLDVTELTALRDVLTNAAAVGIQVVPELHNFCGYIVGTDRNTRSTVVLTTDSTAALNTSHLTDLWARLSTALNGHVGLFAYGLMNEPSGMTAFGGKTPAEMWESISQIVVNTIRANNDNTLMMVPGYNFSKAHIWSVTHPSPWITDNAHNFRYEAHHYWDTDFSGRYVGCYDNALARADGLGY